MPSFKCLAVVAMGLSLGVGSPTQARQAKKRVPPKIPEQRTFPPTELLPVETAKIEEVGAQPCEAPPAAVARAAKKQAESAVRPLPSGDELQLDTKYRKAREDWNAKHVLEGYARWGLSDPAWDAQAREFLAACEPIFPVTDDRLDSDQTSVLVRKSRDVPEECRDPLVLYCKASIAVGQKQNSEAIALLERALREYPNTKYPYAVRIFATDKLAHMYDLVRGPKYERLLELEDRQVREAVAAVDDGEYPADEPRLMLRHLTGLRSRNDDKARYYGRLLPAVKRSPKLDPWVYHILAGEFHVDYGWVLRTANTADKVTEEQFRGFHAQIDLARAHYLSAWDSHPEYPEAADGMIIVTMAMPGGERDAPRFWFDEAVAAKFNYMPAYHRLMWALRPRWGGSHAQMLAFGKECAATSRFDTDVPFVLYDAVWDCTTEIEDKRRYWSEPSIHEALRKMYETAVAEAKEKPRRDRLLTKYAAVMAWGKDGKLAAEILGRLGNDVSAGALRDLGTTLEAVKRDIASGGKSKGVDLLRWRKGLVGVDISADSKTVAIAERNGRFHLIDATKTELMHSFGEAGDSLAGFSLSANGALLAQVDDDGVRIIDAATARLLRTIPAQGEQVDCVFSPDGALLLTTDVAHLKPGAGEMILWDVATGEKKRRLTGHTQHVASMDFSPDGATIASCTLVAPSQNRYTQGELKLWDVATGKEKKGVQPFEGWCGRVKFSLDGKLIFVAGATRERGRWTHGAKLLDAETLEERQVLPCIGRQPRDVLFLPGGVYVAAADPNGSILFWNIETGALVRRLRGTHTEMLRLAVTPTGKLLAPHQSGNIDLFTLDLSTSVVARLSLDLAYDPATAEVYDLRIAPDGKGLAIQVGTEDVIWYEFGRDGFKALPTGAVDDSTADLNLSADGKRLLVAGGASNGDGGVVQVVDVATGLRTKMPFEGKRLNAAAWSPDQSMFVCGGNDCEVYLRDAEGRALGKCVGHTRPIQALAFTPDGGRFISAGSEGVVRIWKTPAADDRKPDADRQIEPEAMIRGIGPTVFRAGISSDGKLIALTGKGVIRLVDLETRKEKRTFPGYVFAFSPDGKQVATAGGEELKMEVQIWDVDSGEKKSRLTGGHREQILSMVYSPDGSRLFSGGRDWRVQCWNLENANVDWTFPWLKKDETKSK